VHITIATASGKPVDRASDLHRNLVQAMNRIRDTSVHVVVDTYTPRYFNIQADVMVDERYIRGRSSRDKRISANGILLCQARIRRQVTTQRW